jgi:hypothetical protein
MIYLIQYDRVAGALVQFREFAANNLAGAEDARLSLELSLLEKKVPHEVVLLDASSEHELRKTHRRYFESLEQMLASAQTMAL